ncbi:YtxH domain-containing protein [Vagococcus intermedius]|uniref:YtxH domain-containing protein n=1 Tax=Vagococcus intermedius TaxID=2991418 RepID=A0AAF0CVH8_9ENTE|nr:YtxH domain-containing protein [Vagococcus intermedius]WEG73730.1 YtxH domain-containing protein [Vagococcus intermedius]WEG75815.1 YtxH domain-containing protein [Vagococcus intermedius]
MIKRFAKGILVGSVLGGVLGTLLAPRSGKETKQKLAADMDEATAVTTELNDSLAKFKVSLTELKKTADDLIPKTKAETEERIQHFKYQAEPRLNEINKQVDKIKSRLDQENKS